MRNVMKIAVLLSLVLPLFGFQNYQGNRSELYLRAADRLLANGHPERALQYMSRAIELDPRSTKGYLKRGFFYLQNGEQELALKDFSSIVEIAPSDANGYLTRGMLYSQRGEKDLAAADFKKGCELGDADSCKLLKELEAPPR